MSTSYKRWIPLKSCISFFLLLSFDFSMTHNVQGMEVLSVSCIKKSWPCESPAVLRPSLGKGSRTWLLGLGFHIKGHIWQVSIPHRNFFLKVSHLSEKKEHKTMHQAVFRAAYHVTRRRDKQLAREDSNQKGWSLKPDWVSSSWPNKSSLSKRMSTMNFKIKLSSRDWGNSWWWCYCDFWNYRFNSIP